MYLALTIIIAKRLSEWDEEAEEGGKCYNTDLLASPDASHPRSDQTYVVITGASIIAVMLSAVFTPARWRHSMLVGAFLQFPLHLYAVIVLKKANTSLLEGEVSEADWDFGQTVAVLLLGVTINEMLSKCWEFLAWEKEVRKDGRVIDHLPEATVEEGLMKVGDKDDFKTMATSS
jgi:hypothetical protein